MRIVCPACEAAYEVPDTVVSPGRVVRCVRCGKDWAPIAKPVPAAAAYRPEPARPAPVPEPALAAQSARTPEYVSGPVPLPGPAQRVTDPGATANFGPLPVPPPAMGPPLSVPPVKGYPVPAKVRKPKRKRGGALLVLAWLVSLAVLGAAA